MLRSFVSVVAGSLLLVGLALAQNDSRPAVPKKAELAEAEKLVKSLFKAEYLKTKAADRAEFAAKLLEQAGESKDDLKAKYFLLQEARDMAAKAGDHETYLKAADEIAGSFDITVAEARAGAIDVLAVGVTGADKSRDAAQALLEVVDAAIAAGEFDAAQKLLRGAEAIGKRSGAPALTNAYALRTKSLPALKKDFEKIAEAQKKVEATPTDGPANLLLGRFQCFVKNDWDSGLARLVLGNDEGMRVAAEKDAKAANGTANDKVEAGDSWYKIGESLDPLEKTNIHSRALHWYKESLGELTGLGKVRIEKRVDELAKTTPAAANENLAKWTAIKNAVKSGEVKDWNIVGGAFSKRVFREVPQSGAILIGFRYTTQTNGRYPDMIQAIYKGPQGDVNGAAGGYARTRSSAIMVTKAKAGYAVGAIFTRGGGGLDSFTPIYMKITENGLDPNDKYEGPVIGSSTGGGGGSTLGGDGNFIVGIHGKLHDTSGKVEALSVVSLTTVEGGSPLMTKKKKKTLK
jgi:hypothetical protein